MKLIHDFGRGDFRAVFRDLGGLETEDCIWSAAVSCFSLFVLPIPRIK